MERKLWEMRKENEEKSTEGSGEEHNSSHKIPSIDASITTSSSKLDLTIPNPKDLEFEVTVELTLHHTGPITFVWWLFPLFSGRFLFKGGLDFIDVESGQKATRDEELCFLPDFCEGLPNGYRTLIPEEPKQFSDIISWDDDYGWEFAEGLKDGRQYDIKLGGCDKLSLYFEGTTDEAISSFRNTKSIDFTKETILLNQVGTPRISVSRSDGGGYESDHTSN